MLIPSDMCSIEKSDLRDSILIVDVLPHQLIRFMVIGDMMILAYVSESLSCSQTRTGQGSPLTIWTQIRNNIYLSYIDR